MSRSKWSRVTSIRHLSTRPKKRLRNWPISGPLRSTVIRFLILSICELKKNWPPSWGMALPWFIWLHRCWCTVPMSGAIWLDRVDLSDPALSRPWLGSPRSILFRLTMFAASASTVNSSQTVLMDLVLICRTRIVQTVATSSVKWTGYSLWNLPWFRWGQGTRYRFELLWGRSAKRPLGCPRYLWGRICL